MYDAKKITSATLKQPFRLLLFNMYYWYKIKIIGIYNFLCIICNSRSLDQTFTNLVVISYQCYWENQQFYLVTKKLISVLKLTWPGKDFAFDIIPVHVQDTYVRSKKYDKQYSISSIAFTL